MKSCIYDVNKGATYRKATQGKDIAISTLWYRRKAVNDGMPLRARRGPKPKLQSADEKLMSIYLQECRDFRIPKRKVPFCEEVAHYMECYDIDNTFPNKIPGRGWQDRFKIDYPNVKFATTKEEQEKPLESISLEAWLSKRNRYVSKQNQVPHFWSNSAIFMLDCVLLSTPEARPMSFHTMTTTKADGESLMPLIVHSGCISPNLQQMYGDKLGFVETDDGLPNFNSVGGCVSNIYDYLTHFEIMSPAIVFLTPATAKLMSFCLWKFAKDVNIVLHTIPQCVYSRVTDDKLSFGDKFLPKFQQIVQSRCLKWKVNMTHALYLESVYQTMLKGKFSGQVKSAFSRLKISTLPQPMFTPDYNDMDSDEDDDENISDDETALANPNPAQLINESGCDIAQNAVTNSTTDRQSGDQTQNQPEFAQGSQSATNNSALVKRSASRTYLEEAKNGGTTESNDFSDLIDEQGSADYSGIGNDSDGDGNEDLDMFNEFD